jgi:hypothetical protein
MDKEYRRFENCHIYEHGENIKTIANNCEVIIKGADLNILMNCHDHTENKPLSNFDRITQNAVDLATYLASLDVCPNGNSIDWGNCSARSHPRDGEFDFSQCGSCIYEWLESKPEQEEK